MARDHQGGPEGADAEPSQAPVARQPIYDRHRGIFAYELMFHVPLGAGAPVGVVASACAMIDAITRLDINQVTDERPAFINLSWAILIKHHDLLPQGAGIEVSCAAGDDDAVAEVLTYLARQGVLVALDDFRWEPGVESLLEHACLVKIDIRDTEPEVVEALIARLRDYPVKRLALNVDSQEAFDHCKALGFDYFQGFFLCRPRAVTTPGLPDSKLNTLRLLAALQAPEPVPDELAAIIRSDLTLHYRLLRTVNSAYYGMPVEVKSIAHAIVYLGMTTVRRWASLQLLAAGDDGPPEVLRLALVRARMCEQLVAEADKETRDKAFTTGLFSLLDGAFDTPMEVILAKLPLERDVARALASLEGPCGQLLHTVACYETGDWDRLEEAGLYELETVTRCYLHALPWARQQFAALGS